MTTIHQNHRRTHSHCLFMGVVIAVFAISTIVSSCRNEGVISKSEHDTNRTYISEAVAQMTGMTLSAYREIARNKTA